MCAINISVVTCQFSHCYLYSGMRKEMWGITFWPTFVIAKVISTMADTYNLDKTLAFKNPASMNP
jgi:hypothetical protein